MSRLRTKARARCNRELGVAGVTERAGNMGTKGRSCRDRDRDRGAGACWAEVVARIVSTDPLEQLAYRAVTSRAPRDGSGRMHACEPIGRPPYETSWRGLCPQPSSP